MQSNKTQLVINADDFGYSPGVSSGILYAHQHGIVTSTTVMVNSAFAKQAVDMAKSYPQLGIGLHFLLDMGHPVLPHINSLTDSLGQFLKGEQLIRSADKKDIKAELKAQLDLLLSWETNITHIDSHHHMHENIPVASEAVTEVAREYNLPVRSIFSEELPVNIVKNNHFIKDFYGENNISFSSLTHLLSHLKSGVTEMMCHPAFVDTWVYKGSSYNLERMKELETLVDKRLPKWLDDHNIKLINYGNI